MRRLLSVILLASVAFGQMPKGGGASVGGGERARYYSPLFSGVSSATIPGSVHGYTAAPCGLAVMVYDTSTPERNVIAPNGVNPVTINVTTCDVVVRFAAPTSFYVAITDGGGPAGAAGAQGPAGSGATPAFGAPYHFVDLFAGSFPVGTVVDGAIGMLGWGKTGSGSTFTIPTGISGVFAGYSPVTTTAQNSAAGATLGALRTDWAASTHLWKTQWDFLVPAPLTSIGVWIGVHDGIEAQNGVYLRFSTAIPDTNFMLCHSRLNTTGCLNTGVPVDSVLHTLHLDKTTTTTIHLRLDSGPDCYISSDAGANDATHLYGVTLANSANAQVPGFQVKNYAADVTSRSLTMRRFELIWP